MTVDCAYRSFLIVVMMMMMLCIQVQPVTATSSEASPSPRKPLGSFMHRSVALSHSPGKAASPKSSAARRTTSPFTRSGKARLMRANNAELFDMSTQVTCAPATVN